MIRARPPDPPGRKGVDVPAMSLERRECGIHALWPGTGGAGVTGVRFAHAARGATATSWPGNARFRVRTTPTGPIRRNGIALGQRGCGTDVVGAGLLVDQDVNML